MRFTRGGGPAWTPEMAARRGRSWRGRALSACCLLVSPVHLIVDKFTTFEKAQRILSGHLAATAKLSIQLSFPSGAKVPTRHPSWIGSASEVG